MKMMILRNVGKIMGGLLSARSVSQYGLLFLILPIYLVRAWRFLNLPTPPDATGTYLPLAKKLLEQGWRFFLTLDSIQVGPATYTWFALFGAEDHVMRYVNLFSGCLAVLLSYGIARRMHSSTAGLLAAFLFACSPLLVSWIPRSLTEAPFFVFTLAWLWGVGALTAGKRWGTAVAVVALSLSILTRPVWLYPSVLVAGAAAVCFIFLPKIRVVAGKLMLVHVLALILPGVFIVKNLLLFGVPSIATGGGGALFYGTNLLTGGFEPPLLGLNYEGLATSFFTAPGDRDHAIVAAEFLRHRSLPDLCVWFANKISWVMFFTPLDASARMSWVRIVELGLALTTMTWGLKRKNFLVLFVGGGVALQILQTALVLYNIRYSVGNIELLLVPLAAVGAAIFLGVRADGANQGSYAQRPLTQRERLAGILCLCILIPMFYLRVTPRIGAPAEIPVSVLYEKELSGEFVAGKIKDESVFVLAIPALDTSKKDRNLLWQVRMTAAAAGPVQASCKQASISYSMDGRPQQSIDFKFAGGGDYMFGTAYEQSSLLPLGNGWLEIHLKCLDASGIRIQRIAFVESKLTEVYQPQHKLAD